MTDLVSACRELLTHRAGDLPHRGWLRDTDESRAALAKVVEAITEIDAFQAAEAQRQIDEKVPHLALKVTLHILGICALAAAVIAFSLHMRT